MSDELSLELARTVRRSTIPGPRQWFGPHRLMWGILDDLARTLERARRSHCNDAGVREARRWLDNNDRTWPFSFLRICEALDLPPGTTRRRLRSGTVASEHPATDTLAVLCQHGAAGEEPTGTHCPARARGC